MALPVRAYSGYTDNCNSETAALRKKLQLKSEALNVLGQELTECRGQRDEFKLMAEEIQARYLQMKKQCYYSGEEAKFPANMDDTRRMDLFREMREERKCLEAQVESLKEKLTDARADIKVLRATSGWSGRLDRPLAPDIHQREEMIEQLEKLNVKCAQLQADLQAMTDEKHELETERDAFKSKAHRLNHQLSKALSAKTAVDLDALTNENRFLQERLRQSQEEKEFARQSLSKYKGMLDSKRTKGTIKLGGNSSGGTVMTYKQVEQLLQQATQIPPHKSAAAINDLRRLCSALLDSLNDKTLALVHQKKANKILASRICELDSAVQSPTMKLLEGYVDSIPGDDDGDLEHEDESTTSENLEKRDDDVGSPEESVYRVACTGLRAQQPSGSSIDLPDLPKNLGELVEKALLDLRDNDKDK